MSSDLLPTDAAIAVYDLPRGGFELRRFPIRPPGPGELLVKVRMCTICRSDVHSYLGHRPSPIPGVLGHEIIGDIVALGEGAPSDLRGDPLRTGDRITWSEYFAPQSGHAADVLDLPQKSRGVDKYGHMAATTAPHHHGGFGQYCYVLPRSWVVRLPDELSDDEATPINCGVATAVCLVESAGIRLGDTVAVLGLGLLGLYACAIARARGARRVIGIDVLPQRRAMGSRFGCDLVLDPMALGESGLVEAVREACKPDGADAVIEACGLGGVVPAGLAMLRVGGSLVLGGVVNPFTLVSLDLSVILRRMLTVRGVHNYHPRHLLQAVDFVLGHRHRYPFAALVDGHYPLDQADRAMDDAIKRRVLRAAIVP